MGPHEVSVNSQELLGRAKAEARLLAAHGWKPVHLTLGSGAVGRQVQQLAQEFGDQRLFKSDTDRPPRKPQSRRPGSRGAKEPISKNSREGWVQWQQPKRGRLLERESGSRSGAADVQQSQQSQSPLPADRQEQQKGPSASSPVKTGRRVTQRGSGDQLLLRRSAEGKQASQMISREDNAECEGARRLRQ